MNSILKLDKVTKIYDEKVVVGNASFEIERGKVYGLLGPNGAGKTTIMKIIINEVKCERGSVIYSDNLKIKHLQDVPEFYEFYTINEYLNFILDISHYKDSKETRINEVLELLNLMDYKDKTIKKLSRGLRQKVGIASVIVEEPDILILDEPVSALDPFGRKEMFDIIASLKGKVTIIFSSHILDDIERVCDHVILINKGKIILDKDIKDITLDKKTLIVTFRSREDLMKIKEKLEYPNSFSERIKDCLEIDGDDISKMQKDVFSLLMDNNVVVNCVAAKKESLEEIFLREVRKNG